MPRKRQPAESALRSSQDPYRMLLDDLNDAIFLHDLSGRLLEANPAACQRLGYARDELLRMTVAEITSPDNAEKVPQRIEEVFRKGSMVFETVHVARDARQIPTEVSAQAVQREGRPAILAVARDITRRKRMEETLQASEERYRKLFDRSNDGILIHDVAGEILDANRKILEQLGYERDEILSLGIADLHPPDAHEASRRALETVGREGLVSFEVTFLRKDGRTFPAEVSASLFEVGGRELVQGVIRDITERKQAETALREQGAFLAAIINRAAEGLCVCHAIDEFPYVAVTVWNDRMVEITGYTMAEINRLGWYQAMYPDPDTQRRASERMDQMRQGEDLRAEEWEITCADGQKRVVRISTSLLEAGGGTGHVLALMDDVTDHRLAREEQEVSQRRFRELYEGSRDGYAVVDMTGAIVEFNSAFRDLLGYADEELRSKTYGEITPEKWHDMEERILREQVFDRGYSDVYEKEYRRKDGVVFPIEIRTYLLRDAAGEPVGMWAFVRDISERRLLEDQLRQAQKMEAVGRLAGGIAHDFNNQLTVIKGYCDLLLAPLPDDAPLRVELEEIHRACQRSQRLTNQLLAFSRRQVLQPKVTNLNEILAEMYNPLARMIGEDIELAIVSDRDLGNVRVDGSQVEQAVMNMTVNARDAMPDGGKLRIETANVILDATYAQQHPDVTPGPHVLLVVTDTGKGMPEDVRERIFEPFYTTKETGKGTGLGLSMVYGFVRQSGGSIDVRTQPGKGTSFRVYLPRVFEAVEKPARQSPTMQVAQGAETILVAEDDEAVRRLVVRTLRDCHYAVLEAGDARQALPLGEHYDGPIDLLITDVVMPFTSGPELADRLKAVRADMEVLFLSGYPEDSRADRPALPPGVNFLGKPFSPEQLARTVRRVLDASRPTGRKPG